MAWLVPENKLDPQQREFVNNVNIDDRNIWIKGFPGSGKSVLLAHTLKKIKRRNPNASVLVVVFTRALIEMFKAAFSEMGLNASIVTQYEFLKSKKNYDYILCDEVQDLTPRVLSAMNLRAKHIVVAGDSNQSIYIVDPKYWEATVNASEIANLIMAKDFELGVIHRLSSSIISAIQKFLPRMNIFTAKRDLTKQSTQVRECISSSVDKEVQYIMNEATKAIRVGQTAAVLIPTQAAILEFVNRYLKKEGKNKWTQTTTQYGKIDFEDLNNHLRKNNVPLQYVGNGYGSFSEEDKRVVLMTYHSAKGLDFDNVFLPFVNQNLYIVPDESLSKILFMVAMTRSRNNLYITYTGIPNSYLLNFRGDCSKIDIDAVLNNQQKGNKVNSLFGF